MSAWDYALVNSRNAPLLREFERYGYASGLIRFQASFHFWVTPYDGSVI